MRFFVTAFRMAAIVALLTGATSADTIPVPDDAASKVLPVEQLVLHVEHHASLAKIDVLSWDTEGGRCAETNLLRAGQSLGLRVRVGGQEKLGEAFPAECETLNGQSVRYRLNIADNTDLYWTISPTAEGLGMSFSIQGKAADRIQAIELVFPFDPGVTPTTVLPSQWAEGGSLCLPAVISSPDFGQMLLTEVSDNHHLTARLEGSRSKKAVDFVVSVPVLQPGKTCSLSLTPLYLAAPSGLQDTNLWKKVRRGWFGAFQPSSKWGDQGNRYSAPAGILANNVISDPASCSLWFYADQALWTPQITREISVASLVRRSVDWWLDHRTRPTGEVVCYWDFGNFLDANAGPLIAVWALDELSKILYLRHARRLPW